MTFGAPAAEGAEYQVGGKAPPPNDGNTGSIYHWDTIRRIGKHLRGRGYVGLRTDQQQVKAGRGGADVVAGVNRPDLQARRGRQRVVVEVDTDPVASRDHQRTVIANDRKARGIFVVIDPANGRVKEMRTYNPATGVTTTRTRRLPGSKPRRRIT